LAVVRGLEALSQPSRVTLLTGSRYLRHGLDSGISQWRENDWQWERYGRMAPVKNSDLWQRLDRLLNIHALECRPTQLEKADDLAPPRRRKELPADKLGRVVRVDAAHGAANRQQRPSQSGGAENQKNQTNSKSKRRDDRRFVLSRRWNLGNWSLLGAWSWMLEILQFSRGLSSKRAPLAHRLRSTNKES